MKTLLVAALILGTSTGASAYEHHLYSSYGQSTYYEGDTYIHDSPAMWQVIPVVNESILYYITDSCAKDKYCTQAACRDIDDDANGEPNWCLVDSPIVPDEDNTSTIYPSK